jgi:hypothetical protein
MTDKVFFSSLTRIADLHERAFDTVRLGRDRWETGDYVLARVSSPPRGYRTIELRTGRSTEVVEDDVVAGALGDRHATLETVGTWRAIGDDGQLEAMTAAGLFGLSTSMSAVLPPLLPLSYEGHAMRDGEKLNMRDFVPDTPEIPYDRRTVLVVGSSMSAGKTASAKVIIRQLKKRGLRVTGCKLSGAGRYRDILAMRDAGADEIFDFVDIGLPSSICPKEQYRPLLRQLLSRIAAAKPHVVVAEAGASPLEPYNGDTVVETIGDQLRCTILCASDPYAVVGVMQGFQMQPDLVAGLATSTSAGVELIHKLTGITALNLLEPASMLRLMEILDRRLG